MIKAVRHIGVIVKDIKKSTKFYEDFFNLQQWQHDTESGEFIDNLVGLENVTIEWVKLKTPDGILIELLQYHTHPDSQDSINVPQVGAAHIAFTVDNADDIFKKLAKNYQCKFIPQRRGSVKVFYCQGPDGVTLELVEEIND